MGFAPRRSARRDPTIYRRQQGSVCAHCVHSDMYRCFDVEALYKITSSKITRMQQTEGHASRGKPAASYCTQRPSHAKLPRAQRSLSPCLPIWTKPGPACRSSTPRRAHASDLAATDDAKIILKIGSLSPLTMRKESLNVTFDILKI